MIFLDSNILIYAADETDAVKFEKACGIIERAVGEGDFMVSAQVINEFSSVMFRKLRKSDEEVREMLSILKSIRTVPVMPEWTLDAVNIKSRYGLQFYDSLLLAAAAANGCTEFWSEDLADGQTYDGVKVVNPF